MDNYWYMQGYEDALHDVRKTLHEERVSTDGHGDPMAVWWSKYWVIQDKLYELWKRRLVNEETRGGD